MIWTARHVENWLIEAAETLWLLPPDRGPRQYGNSMPVPVRDHQSYGYQSSRYIRRASPNAIDRMMQVWEWLSSLSESERRLLYGWAETKAWKGARLEDFALKEGIKSRTLRSVVSRLCQRIADRLNREPQQHERVSGFDDIAETLIREGAFSVEQSRCKRQSTFHRDPELRLVHDSSPETSAIVQREIERLNRRARKRRRRKRK